MELPIFNHILFRDLRPGQIGTTDRKKFMALVKTANAVSPANYAELLAQLSELLNDFSALRKTIAEPTPLKVKLQPRLFSVPLPRHTDPFTQFYSLLVEKETLRVSNLLIQQVAALPDVTDKIYNVKLALRSVRVLAAKTAKHLRESGFTAFPDGCSTLEHFVFFTQKQMLSALFFEIQERYKDLMQHTETEESFSNNYLQLPDNPLQLQHTPDYFEYHINRFIDENKFSAQAAQDLLSQIPQDAKFANLQAAFENLIFLRSQNHDNPVTFDQLTNQDFVAEHLSLAKQAATTQLQSLQYGHERLDVVNPILDNLDYVTSTNKLSIPHLYRKWLSEQKVIYTTRFSEKFPVTARSKKQKDNNRKPAKATFGFHGDTSKLKTVLSQLCTRFDLLNVEKNNADELFALLTAKDINRNPTKIFIGCETKQFRYIIDKLSPQFSNLTPKMVGESGLFHSKNDTILNAQNFYSSKTTNPKDKETIDKILKQLQ